MNLAEGTVRESGVVFHPIGIADEDNDHGFKGWKMRTLSTDVSNSFELVGDRDREFNICMSSISCDMSYVVVSPVTANSFPINKLK